MDINTDAVVDLQCCPVLSKAAETVRAKASAYVDRMADLGKTPSQVVLFAADYDAVIEAIKRRRESNRKGEIKPPPIDGLSYGALPVLRGGRG